MVFFSRPTVDDHAPAVTGAQSSQNDPDAPTEVNVARELATSMGERPREAASRSNEPSLVAIADFEPPPSHQTQMLKLYVGDAVTVIGQDGRGWWYGRKQNGKEGWFPPSYVQLKSAHFSSSGTAAAGA